jgi:uncharacterized protein (UPF0333 family)
MKRNNGQTTLEYAILVIIIIGVLLTISAYIKRGIQGRVKSSADDVGEQYDPGNTNYMKWTNSQSNTLQTFANGVSQSALMAADTTNVESSQNIVNLSFGGYWGTP